MKVIYNFIFVGSHSSYQHLLIGENQPGKQRKNFLLAHSVTTWHY
jgi:hypothetical protein